MTTKQRIRQLEKQKPTVKLTWKDFIDWTNGKVFDADTESQLRKEWGEFIADKDKPTANTQKNNCEVTK